MNRLQKKCLIAATGMHLLLLVILFVGPAFLSSSSKPDDSQVIDFIPANLIDKPFANAGGNPSPKPAPAPVQTQTQVQPTPKPVEPVKAEPKPVKPVPESLEAKPTKPKPQISTTLVTRKNTDTTTSTKNQDAADARRRAADLNKTVRNLREGLSSSTTIETPRGNTGSGEAYASYAFVVKSIYETQWIAPDNTASDDATAKVTITIVSDGTVISARITTPSGDEQTDASIQRTLDRIKFIAPFPEGSKDTQRTYIINFNLKAKRLST